MNASFQFVESWGRWTNVGLVTHSLGEARTTLKDEWYCNVRADMSNCNGDGKGSICANTPNPQKSSKYIENSVQEWLSCANWIEFNKAKNTSCDLKLKLYRWSALDFISSFNCLEPGK